MSGQSASGQALRGLRGGAGGARASRGGAPVRLAVLCAVAFMAQLDLFIVNLALPAMGQTFAGAGLGGLSWVLNAYSIVFAACLVPAGRLADHFGRRRFLLAGLAVFTGASALCAAAPDLAVLVAARALEAAGAAVIVPTSLGLLLALFPRRRHGLVVGLWAGSAAVAATAGPPAAGPLVAADWRWVFLINVPIGLLTAVAGWLALPEVRGQAGARLPDPVSALTAVAGITLLTLAIVQGTSWGWASGREGIVAAGFAVAAAVALRRTFTHRSPLVEPDLFRSREFSAASIALLLFFVMFASWVLGTVLFFRNVWHYPTLRTGLAIAPGPLGAAVLAPVSGRLADIAGRRVLAFTGPLLFGGAAVWWLLAATARPDYAAGILPGLILAGAGSGLTQAPLLAATSTLPAERAATGSAVLNMARQVGSALGVALLVAVYASASPHALAAFRRGWILMAVAGLGASLASVLIRTGAPSPESG